MLFGAGRFAEFFDTPLAGFFDAADESQTDAAAQVERMRKEAQVRLAAKLADKLTRIIAAKMTPAAQQAETAEAAEMAEAPGGAELLYLVGYCYVQEARQHSKSFLGITSFVSEFKEKVHIIKEAMSAISSAAKTQAMQQQEGGGDEAAVIQQGLKTIWKSGKLDIELSVRGVCEHVLRTCATHALKAQRCKALEWLGTIFKTVGRAAQKSSGSTGPPKFT
jgi:hypothetical protein